MSMIHEKEAKQLLLILKLKNKLYKIKKQIKII